MNAPIMLVSEERTDGRRFAISWIERDDGGHRLRISIDRAENGEWVTGYYVDLTPGEVFRAHDGIGLALHYAMRAKR